MNIDSNHSQYAIYGGPQHGPTFGSGCDIRIYNNPNTENNFFF
jgi:hypothetical protein